MWGNTVTIHSILKKKNYKTKFSTSSILKKKITKNNSVKKTQKIEKKKKKTILEKKKQKKMKKKHTGKVKAEFSTSSLLKKNWTEIILEKTCGETL
jgi:hypothetical protein